MSVMRTSMDSEEASLREELAAALRLVADFGWDDLIFTHLSLRLPGSPPEFLINPWDLAFDEITPDALVRVNLDGLAVEATPHVVNPAGFTIHSALHMAREDAVCVIHLHTLAGVAVSCQAAGLLPIQQNAMLLSAQIGYHDYEGVALSLDERARLLADLGGGSILILRNHGTLVTGRSVAEAFTRMYFLERACQMQIAAQAAALHWPSAEAIANTQAQAARGLSRVGETLLWPALRRRLDRRQPNWRTR